MAELVTEIPAVALAVYAHPDDPDVAAGGTLSVWARNGSVIHVCICADGDKGSADPDISTADLIGTRRAEVEEAGRLLGVREHYWLGHRDGELDNDALLRRQLVALIREIRPQVLMAPDPTAVFFGQHYVNHRDHLAVGWASLDAAAPAASNPRYFPDAGPAHRLDVLYLSGSLEPDVWVDISSTIDTKAAAVACHASQVGEAGEWLRAAVRERAEDAGRRAGVSFAEGFRRVRLTG